MRPKSAKRLAVFLASYGILIGSGISIESLEFRCAKTADRLAAVKFRIRKD